MEEHGTIKWGAFGVPLLQRQWKSGPKQPYRKTYSLKAGQSWYQAPTSSSQFEAYVEDGNLGAVPVGALIALELLREGASTAVFVEMWGGVVFVDGNLVCVSADGVIGEIFRQSVETNGKKAGFPDAFGVFPDGRIAFREAKNRSRRDRLGPAQHQMADSLRTCFGERADLAVVEWDT